MPAPDFDKLLAALKEAEQAFPETTQIKDEQYLRLLLKVINLEKSVLKLQKKTQHGGKP